MREAFTWRRPRNNRLRKHPPKSFTSHTRALAFMHRNHDYTKIQAGIIIPAEQPSRYTGIARSDEVGGSAPHINTPAERVFKGFGYFWKASEKLWVTTPHAVDPTVGVFRSLQQIRIHFRPPNRPDLFTKADPQRLSNSPEILIVDQ